MPQLLSSTTSVLALEFLEKQLAFTTAESRASIWSSVFATALPSSVLLQLIRAVGDGVLPADFENVELDDSILETLSRVLSDESVDAVELEVITRLINQPGECNASITIPEN